MIRCKCPFISAQAARDVLRRLPVGSAFKDADLVDSVSTDQAIQAKKGTEELNAGQTD